MEEIAEKGEDGSEFRENKGNKGTGEQLSFCP